MNEIVRARLHDNFGVRDGSGALSKVVEDIVLEQHDICSALLCLALSSVQINVATMQLRPCLQHSRSS